jgi:hypothetical protein
MSFNGSFNRPISKPSNRPPNKSHRSLYPIAYGQAPRNSTMQNAEDRNSQPELTLAAVLNLTQQSDLTTMQSWLSQVSPRIVAIDCPVSKSELRQFIAWALQQSDATSLSSDEKLKLLDIAWEVQNLLWRLC